MNCNEMKEVLADLGYSCAFSGNYIAAVQTDDAGCVIGRYGLGRIDIFEHWTRQRFDDFCVRILQSEESNVD